MNPVINLYLDTSYREASSERSEDDSLDKYIVSGGNHPCKTISFSAAKELP